MNRSELIQIAHGLKAARPPKYGRSGKWDAIDAGFCEYWEMVVQSVADHLALRDKPRSNFLAACGLLHANEDPTEPGRCNHEV